ncbi:Hsp20/alpha crystallin family protein [Aquibacillus rhizosphaerae]|uniref:Hsp20/alpha crystallin family protein n=1 Tax=Aquibacillus rhizosphaerae TaxID=3051431 RepID=A0ABT7L833_9BACI|nr:Hsp20/alpha crystallin family protein [Aquibacillus sp. LR5S19]MDL4842009.1 Hsp20/alpha crystallin family protein [Aquibacillus sp. LR5S19]
MDPFRNMGDWKKNMDNFFGDTFWNEFEDVLKPPVPQINLYKFENELICYVNLPGVKDLEKVDVFVDYATLELKGMIDINHSGGEVIKDEIIQGVFERKVELPYPVRKDKINATYQHGLLVLQLHRLVKEGTKKSRLEIKNLEDN